MYYEKKKKKINIISKWRGFPSRPGLSFVYHKISVIRRGILRLSTAPYRTILAASYLFDSCSYMAKPVQEIRS